MEYQRENLYPGMDLSFVRIRGEEAFRMDAKGSPGTMIIHYCLSGRVGWEIPGGNQLYLGAGDFFVNTRKNLENAEISAPNGDYEGLTVELSEGCLEANPPEPLENANLTGGKLLAKFGSSCAVFAAEKQVQQIFESIFHAPAEIAVAYRKIKALELLLILGITEDCREKRLTEYRPEQVEVIRQIHDRLTGNLEQRCSIEALSRQYLMNPTTLKQMFKTIYGTSIASHIREHRMEAAAQLLADTDLSIADIAQKVGYDSQSRFSAAFKEYYGMLPKEYRRKCAQKEISPAHRQLD